MAKRGKQADRLTCWAEIKTDYLTGYYSLQQLANKYGCARQTIERRVKAESWNELRADHIKRIADEALAQSRATSVEAMTKVIKAAAELPDRLQAAIDAADTAITIRDIKAAADALESTLAVLMRGGRIPTAAEEASQQAAAQRLELERQRLELDRQRTQTGDGGAVIQIVGEAEGYAD